MDRANIYSQLEAREGQAALIEHLKNKRNVERRIYIALVTLILTGFIPYLFIEAYLWFGIVIETPGEWLQRSGALMVAFSVIAEIIALSAKDAARLGGYIGYAPHGPKLLKEEARWPVGLITFSVVVLSIIGTLVNSFGDILFNAIPVEFWALSILIPAPFCLAVLISVYLNRPILTTGHD